MERMEALILNRSNRKYWYVKYQMFFKNGRVVTKEESTKVGKNEKKFAYMTQVYLPLWIKQKKDSINNVKIKNKSFSYYSSIFLNDYKKNHDYKNIKYRTDRIMKDFGDQDIDTITKFDVKIWLDSLTNLNTNNKILSTATKKKYLRIFHGIFELALDNEVIKTNFTFDIKLKSDKRDIRHTIMPFSGNEVKLIIEKSKDNKYGEYIYNYLGIAFHQGMSPSEILGLQIDDIDLNKQQIAIKRNVTKNVLKETKTSYRNRIIPIFDSSIKFVNNLIIQAKSKKTIWLFSDSKGQRLSDIKVIRGDKSIKKNGNTLKNNTKWYKLLQDLNIEYREIKNCRHTFAVSSIESGKFTLQQIANILGHSDLKMLLEHYAKWIGDKALSLDRKILIY
jgi:integrase